MSSSGAPGASRSIINHASSCEPFKTLPLTITEGTDANRAAQSFCDSLSLREASSSRPWMRCAIRDCRAFVVSSPPVAIAGRGEKNEPKGLGEKPELPYLA